MGVQWFGSVSTEYLSGSDYCRECMKYHGTPDCDSCKGISRRKEERLTERRMKDFDAWLETYKQSEDYKKIMEE